MKQEYCKILGEKTRYLRIGNENSAKKIVILHGWDPTKVVSEGFIPLAKILAKKLRAEIIIPDLPGFGQSPLPAKKYVDTDCRDFCENPDQAEVIVERGWSVWDYSD